MAQSQPPATSEDQHDDNNDEHGQEGHGRIDDKEGHIFSRFVLLCAYGWYRMVRCHFHVWRAVRRIPPGSRHPFRIADAAVGVAGGGVIRCTQPDVRCRD